MDSNRFFGLCRRFLADDRGNFAIIFAFAILVVFLSAGLAVDLSRNLGEKTRINNALDAATLATARALSIGEIEKADADDYLEAIFAANLGLDDLTDSGYQISAIVIDDDKQTVTATAKTNQNLTFIKAATGKRTQPVSAKSGATYGITDVEVAMVLDITGSMGGSKIRDLRTAAKLGVTELLSMNTASDEKVRISLVPYADAVNVGPLAEYVFPDYWLAKTQAPAFSADLLDATGLGFDPDDLEDTAGASLDPDDIDELYAVERDGSAPDDCGTDRKAPLSGGTSYQYTDANPSYGMISRDTRLVFCPDSKLVPLSSNQTKLESTITNLNASGHTAGHIGLQWGWYTISHDWADYMPSGSEPAVNDKETAKYIILMTDGEFNTAYADVESDVETYCSKKKRNGKCKRWSKRIDFTRGNQGSQSRTHAEKLCDNIKKDDIKIFTVGFDMNNKQALALLKYCASPKEAGVTYYYEPDTGSELIETYQNIARAIQSLRLKE